MHSFTPQMNGFKRPWHVGVLWNDDPRLPEPLLAELRRDRELVVGDNEPYSARASYEYTLMPCANPQAAALLAGSAPGPRRHARHGAFLGRRLAPAIRDAWPRPCPDVEAATSMKTRPDLVTE